MRSPTMSPLRRSPCLRRFLHGTPISGRAPAGTGRMECVRARPRLPALWHSSTRKSRLPPPEEPERPRRFAGPERRRQQFLLRRLIAVGVGFGFVILLVLGVRGCLEARSDRGLRNYTQDIGTIMQESEQRGEEFFELDREPGHTSLTARAADQQPARRLGSLLRPRREASGSPGRWTTRRRGGPSRCSLRRDALDTIAENVTGAAADRDAPTRSRRSPSRWGVSTRATSSGPRWRRRRSRTCSRAREWTARISRPGNFMPEDATRVPRPDRGSPRSSAGSPEATSQPALMGSASSRPRSATRP